MCFVCEIGKGYVIWNENTWSVSEHSYYKQSSCLSIFKCPVCATIQGRYFPWPLGAVGYQVREGHTEPLIPCSCVHIIIVWELGRSCRLDGRDPAELSSLFSGLFTPWFLPQIMHDYVVTHCQQVTSRFCWVWFVLSVIMNWHTFPEPPRPWSASDSTKPLPFWNWCAHVTHLCSFSGIQGKYSHPCNADGKAEFTTGWVVCDHHLQVLPRACPFICCLINHRNDILF